MYLTGLRLKNYQQFRDFNLDLTDPQTGQPLDKVCFIGSNGTGKTTILALMANFLQVGHPKKVHEEAIICFKVKLDEGEYYLVRSSAGDLSVLSAQVEDKDEWHQIWQVDTKLADKPKELTDVLKTIALPKKKADDILARIKLKPNDNDLAIYAPPEGTSVERLPQANLGQALHFFDDLRAYHISSYSDLQPFWSFLIYQIKKRENDYQQFLQSPETQNLSVAAARQRFDAQNPEILPELAKQWNLILTQAGLEFDTQNAQIPVQLNENLVAFVRHKTTKKQLDYNVLSTGIRNFIFRLGHIYTLYFNRHIERGFLLVDEPEASLFPDLLYDIIERYLSIIENTQFFVATHSPIIAAQFRNVERFILEFDDERYVTWRRGISPEGDDPNDLLLNDFVVRNLYGKKGLEQWQRYLQLRNEISEVKDPRKRLLLLDEYTSIGNAYNFAPHEISE